MAALQTFGPGTLGGLGTFGPGTFTGGTPKARWMVPGPCGCCTCTYFLDRFTRADNGDLGSNWDEQLGTWAIENYRAKTTSSNARLICNAVDTPNNDEHVVWPTLRGMGVGDQPRLISSKLTGADTYWFFQMTYGATTVDLDLYQRTDGSDVQRGSTTTLYNMAPGIPLALRMCFDGAVIRAQYRRITDTIWRTTTSYATTAITDPICGVGTGTVNDEVRVDDFRLEKHGTLYPGCPNCSPECLACSGEMPDEFLIVPTGAILNTNCVACQFLMPAGGFVVKRNVRLPCLYNYSFEPMVCLDFVRPVAGVSLRFGQSTSTLQWMMIAFWTPDPFGLPGNLRLGSWHLDIPTEPQICADYNQKTGFTYSGDAWMPSYMPCNFSGMDWEVTALP